jgi:hypothetical protein
MPRDAAFCDDANGRAMLPEPFDTCEALEVEVRWARRGLLSAFLCLSGEGDGIRDVSSSIDATARD